MTKRKTRPYWLIEQSAKNILELHQCYEKPYEGIDFILQCMNIDLISLENVTDPDLSGLYGNNGTEKFLAFNNKHSPERILFTKAHKLGHIVLDHDLKNDIVKEYTRQEKDPIEMEANVFASGFLMPQELVWGLVRDAKVGVDVSFSLLDFRRQEHLLNLMQERFRVSRTAAGYRLGDVLKIQ